MHSLSTKKKKFLLLDFALLLILTFFDQLAKYFATLHLKGASPVSLIDGALELDYLENRGAAFGLLQNQRIFFILIASFVLLAILYVIFLLPEEDKYNKMHFLLVMMASGALGNLIDRIRTDYVVDFISFILIHFPVFNVADIYVTISTFILAFLFLFHYKEDDFAFLSFRQQKKVRELK